MLSVICFVIMLNLCQGQNEETSISYKKNITSTKNIKLFKPVVEFLPIGFRVSVLVLDQRDAGYFGFYADINSQRRCSNSIKKTTHIRVEGNMTNTFTGILLYENHTVRLVRGDTVRYCIVIHFSDSSHKILVNDTFNTKTLSSEMTHSQSSDSHETATEYEVDYRYATHKFDYIYSLIDKINSTELDDLYRRIPYQSIPEHFYEASPTNERTSYFDKMIESTSELF